MLGKSRLGARSQSLSRSRPVWCLDCNRGQHTASKGETLKKTGLKVRQFSKEDIREYKEKFPLFEPEPLEWAVIDTRTDAAIDFFGTQEEAQAVLDDLNQTLMIGDNFRDWVSKTARKLGVEQEKVLDVVREY